MIIRFAKEARADLEMIGDWIATDNPTRAESFVDELMERSLTLQVHPNRFPEAFRRRDRIVRKMTHAGYLIFYEVADQAVFILRIVHSSRDWASLFDG
jgi:toxin ParE1/3/4